ncbi:MAG: glycosyltransferase family 39 protein [Paracoccaceae bacterium]|nr:glycosyltransferase family 39 protein [Paracoccaceae bacterium]
MPSVAARLSEPRVAALVILGLTLWRLGTLAFDETELWVDEAQYWLWGQHLDWGYFSKPPLIAFWLRAVTDLAGSDSAFWIRVSGSLLHALTAGLIYLSAARLFDRPAGAAAALLYATAPMVTLGSWLFSTDTLLLPCYAAAFYAYLRLREAPSTRWALLMGAALGLGFLAKYAVIYFPLSLALATLLIPSARIAWRGAGLALVTMLVIAAPNLWWNVANGGTTVRHIAKDNAKVDASGMNPASALEFLVSQFVVFGPVAFAAFLLALWWAIRRKAPPNTGLLLIFSALVVAILTVQGLRSSANANWAVTAYVAGAVLAGAILAQHPRWLLAGVLLNLTLVVALPLAYMSAETLRLPNGRLLADRYLGNALLSEEIAKTAAANNLDVVARRRGVLADLFHRYDNALTVFAPPPDGPPGNYYQQVFPLPAEVTGDVLYVTSGAGPCDQADVIGAHTSEDGHYRGLTFTFYRTPAACLRP